MGRSRHAALAALTALCVGCLPAFVSGGPHGLRSATSRSLRSGAVRRAGNEEAGRIVILGAGLQGAALAYFLTRRGVKPVVVERDKVAAAASGKGGGFLARDWGDSITRKLHTVSFKLHEELAETLGIESYRKLPVLSAAPGPRSDRTSDMCPWLDGEVADVRVMDPNGAQVAPLELCTKLMDAAVEAGAELRIGTAEGVETAEDGDIERVTGVIVDGETLPADKVCVCLGPWAALAQDWFGMPVPMTGVKSSSIVFKSDEPVEPFAIFCGEDPRFGTHLEIYPRNSGEVYICGIGGSEYGIKSSEFRSAKPTVVLTQALCDVCAPSSRQVSGARELIQEEMTVVNLEPHSLRDVADTFATVSEAVTGSTKTGDALASEFHAGLGRIASAVSQPERKRPRSPRCVLLEWADPLFDGGHWIPEMLVAAGGEKGWQSPGNKSKKIEPSVLTDYDPDCILVACCGFDLHRNLEDAQKLWSKPWWTSLRCVKEGKVFAADGNRYFARPGPSLVAGVAIMARIIHDDVPGVVSAVEATGLLPAEGVAWGRVEPPGLQASGVPGQPCDIEDLCWSLHKEACQRGERFYLDPKTGYQVMTEVAHKKRGKCCGCGCRHCPYNHANVPSTERAARIQQPAWLHKTSIEAEEVDVLFWSGGKDSYLALRTLLKEKGEGRRGVVLMTTFDARTRIIAHQEVEIKTVVRQAETLGVSLVGAPLHPGRKYEEQLEQALRVAQKGLSGIPITRVCFGDLHLEHIRSWREQQLTPVVREVCGQAAQLHYPIWHKSYEDLMADLVASGVKCRISAMPDAAPSEVQGLCVGALFDPVLAKQATSIGWDAFGENGEFHSVVEPWA